MSTSLFVRNIAQRSLQQGLRRSTISQLSAARFSSYFAPTHEYCKVDGGIATVGISDHAQNALGEIVYVDLPEVGDDVEKSEAAAVVESVKSASDVYAPVSGTVVEVNEALGDSPEIINDSAEENGWFFKVEMSDESDVKDLMDAAAYAEHVKSESG
uniref:Glycine cleavage system H protein n=1 Tax=Craspedostauros australis TaxID=1486917 RepID=A0A7R9ZKY3_9STRA|mmetsp:Transcript_14684/g.40593  ORF Transcript_14684/g.40593 Transcript_14684/m.40593 type:complete len:157 (+) Transcript_14684:446-916(+)|eukprot:CAMPEP_0198133932 /NCGR_PEP_ID=MMETSP1442-20131203/59817_1 /TAXON_ID= /ORGANISM="Craspedostauros australis, Strain CCMP3328" /LENGTH=156 /DNA_ID=CAMNT_0043795067 /DNA_START=536 /DNA_END=1006 /DNA_ORIENTATION=-